MSPQSSSSLGIERGSVLPLPGSDRSPVRADADASRTAEARQKAGKKLILAGFVITIVGVVLYCAVCFAGDASADLGDMLFRNAVPFARATLAVLGLGTVVWLVGSVLYLRGAMDADEEQGARHAQAASGARSQGPRRA
ncbi:MAG: hypothetical protein IT373_14240 [Polyangiaceae bacterium]|nr:hypothetical protein [Polyangiaceae bacterium]